MLIINADGHQGDIDTACVMWTVSFHGSKHYKSIWLPGNPPLPIRYIKNVQCFQSYIQQALDEYQDDLTIISSMSRTKDHPIPTIVVESLRETTQRTMSYIALLILSAGEDAILESHLKSLLSQVEEGVMKWVQGDTAVSKETCPSVNPAAGRYVAEYRATIDKYPNSIFQLLQLCTASTPLPDLTACYDKLWQLSFPIMSGLANLITHLGGKTISSEDIGGFTRQAKQTLSFCIPELFLPHLPLPIMMSLPIIMPPRQIHFKHCIRILWLPLKNPSPSWKQVNSSLPVPLHPHPGSRR